MKDGHIKLTDYAIPYSHRKEKYEPTKEFKDPEPYDPSFFQQAVAVWQIGILTLYMLTGSY